MMPHITFFSLRVAVIVIVIGSLSGCASYYQDNRSFNQEFEKGDLATALQTLKKSPNEGQGRNRFIYYANKGLLY
jgi:hypothetical protein